MSKTTAGLIGYLLGALFGVILGIGLVGISRYGFSNHRLLAGLAVILSTTILGALIGLGAISAAVNLDE